MKKPAVLVVFIAALCVSCALDNWYYTIENNASMPITFTFNSEEITLPAGQSLSRAVSPGQGRQSPQNMTFEGHPRSVKVETRDGGLTFYFVDTVPLNLNIVNTLPITIVNFRADDYICDSGSDKLNLKPNSYVTTTIIFTETPNFTTDSNHPVVIDWKITEDTMYVIIR